MTTPEDVRFEALAHSPAFRGLGAEDQQRLAEALDPVHLPGGTTLMAEGDEADSMYLVHTGRLRVLVHGDGGEIPVGEIGPGEVVGEMAMLSDRNRSATVVAIRDTALWKLSRDSFNELVVTNPGMLLELTRLLVSRLHRTNRAARVDGRVTSVVLLPIDRSLDCQRFAAEFVDALGEGAVKFDKEIASGPMDPQAPNTTADSRDGSDIGRWMHRAEAVNDIVVYVADLEPTPWTHRCLRQADLVLLLAMGDADGNLTEAESVMLWESDSALRPQVDLVLVHAASTSRPSGTAKLLARRDVQRHHHVRDGHIGGFARLSRVVRGRSIGLVLGGGGARGFAHLGVIKALHERNIPIDFVGGTSIGASAAAGVALGWDVPTIIASAKHVTVDRGSLVDVTPPVVALSRGEAISTGLRDVLGDALIEDLWYPMFCVSTDLTDGVARVHTQGSLWESVRSSIAIPGTFPPMRASDGHVLVDGGVVNNLPIDVMTDFAQGATILAVDLRATAHLPSRGLSADGIVSGWGALGARLNPGSPGRDVPRIIDILLRSNEVASSPHGDEPDLMFRPSVDAFGVLDFSSWEELIDMGYREAIEVLDSWSATGSQETMQRPTMGQV